LSLTVALEEAILLESGLRLELFVLEVSDAGVSMTVGILVMVPELVPELVLVVLEGLDDIVVVWFGGGFDLLLVGWVIACWALVGTSLCVLDLGVEARVGWLVSLYVYVPVNVWGARGLDIWPRCYMNLMFKEPAGQRHCGITLR
jgi:hypothetical protein